VSRLYRNSEEQIIAGVCSGLADFFGVSTTLVRLLFLFSGGGCGLYILLWIFVPEREIYNNEQKQESAGCSWFVYVVLAIIVIIIMLNLIML